MILKPNFLQISLLVLASLVTSFLFSCGKSEIKIKNPSSPQTPGQSAGQQSDQSNPRILTTNTYEIILDPETLKLSKSDVPLVLNQMESSIAKTKTRVIKSFSFKSEKKLSLNFKSGLQNIGRSKCETDGQPEVSAVLKISDKETSAKFYDLTTIDLNANQELVLTVSIDNSKKCGQLLFEFAILASEVAASEDPPPPVVVVPVVGQLVVEMKEFLSAGTFGACFDWACFTRDNKTTTKNYFNPTNKIEQIVEDHFALSTSLELVCLNRRKISDTTGITNSVCKLKLNPSLSTNEIKIYRGKDKSSNIVGVDLIEPTLLEKLCNKFPTITSDDKIEVFIDETNKKEIPRLELSCTYDSSQKPKSASFIGVLN